MAGTPPNALDSREPFDRARRILERAGAAQVPSGENQPSRDLALVSELAEALWDAARLLESPGERRERLRMAALVGDPVAQRLAVGLTDRACRSLAPERLVEAVQHLAHKSGTPRGLSTLERLGLQSLPVFGALLPQTVAHLIEAQVAREASSYVLSGEEQLLELLTRRAQGGLQINLSHLGEEVVGEEQAERYARRCLELVQRPGLAALSVKISALFSQTNLVAFDESLAVLEARLRPIYRAALAISPQRLVSLDMESYRDLELTLTLFMSLLEEPELLGLTAGIVLQAYLPDSVAWQRRLLKWAERRCANGGAPVRLRLVKGANLGLERVESSLRGWPLPVLPSKADVDAEFKQMLRIACEPEALEVMHLGIGSHNLFDIAYALILRQRSTAPERIVIEMLHGMAEPLARALGQLDVSVLVYSPAAPARDFPSAVAYLVRRFDENAAEQNFLRHGFSMVTGDTEFIRQREGFERALYGYVERPSARVSVRDQPCEAPVSSPSGGFVNTADTDPSRASDREFLRRCLRPEVALQRVPLSIGDREIHEGSVAPGFDPSRPGLVPYVSRLATAAELEAALEEAARALSGWSVTSPGERVAAIRRAARELRLARGQLITALVLDGGKNVLEADAEVSEAIDFAEYYAACFEELSTVHETEPRGVVVVTPPWNFPLAIPLGGVLAALLTGNTVILKPAGETPLVAYLGVSALWRAGIPRQVLQFVPCRESVGTRLITDPRVDTVVLTGATETARLFLRLRPGLRLIAETGGKNALIVSDLCDRELAIRDAVRSAFGHAGQKCSALSLLIVERSLYESPDFRRQLRDAAASLPVGSAWDPCSVVTPLIRPPTGALSRGLRLDRGESWLLAPERSLDNPRLVSPGIKLGVQPASHSYRRELFGPVLSVLCAETLEHALTLANGTVFGLTAGFHGLDESEQALFIERMQAGNLYVGRTITGALVGRQPFGGHKASSFGPGVKAGGPSYVAQFCRIGLRKGRLSVSIQKRQNGIVESPSTMSARELVSSFGRALRPREREHLTARCHDYLRAFERLARPELLAPELIGEANWLRRLPCRVAVVLGAGACAVDLVSLLVIGELLPGALEFFIVGPARTWWHERAIVSEKARAVETLTALSTAWSRGRPDRVRLVGIDLDEAWSVFGGSDLHVEAEPVSDLGSVELGRYLIEQTISISRHRHGNLGLAEWAPRPRGLF